jgi:DNA repair exonuclease SbcCD ATPase subunit
MTSNIQANVRAIQALDGRIDNDILTRIAENSSSIAAEADRTAKRFQAVDDRSAAADNDRRELHKRIDEANDQIAAERDELAAALHKELSEFRASVDRAANEASDRMLRIEGSATTVAKETKSELDRLDRQRTELERLHQELRAKHKDTAANLAELTSGVAAFQAEMNANMRKFVDQMNQRGADIELAGEAAKRTVIAQCDELRKEIAQAKKQLNDKQTEISDRFSDLDQDHQRTKEETQADLNRFKMEARQIGIAIREESELARKGIVEANAAQQATLKEKIKSLEKTVRDFIGIDGISIQSISEQLAELKADQSDFKTSITSDVVGIRSSVEKKIVELTALISQFKADYKAFTEDIRRQHLAAQDEALQSVRQELAKSGNPLAPRSVASPLSAVEVEVRHGDLEARLADVSEQLKGLKTSAQEQLDAVKRSHEVLSAELDTVKLKLRSVTGTIESNQQTEAGNFDHIRQSIKKTRDGFAQSITQMKTAISATLTELQKDIEKLQRTTEAEVATSANLGAQLEKTEATMKGLQDIFGDSQQEQRKSTENAAGRLAQLESQLTALSKSFAAFIDGSSDTAMGILRKVSGVDGKLDKQVSVLESTIREFRAAMTKKFADQATQGAAELNALGKTNADARSLFENEISKCRDELASSESKVASDFAERLAELSKRLDSLVGHDTTTISQLKGLITGLQTGTEAKLTALRDATSNKDSEIERSVARVKSLCERIQDGLGTLDEATKSRVDSQINLFRDSFADKLAHFTADLMRINVLLNGITGKSGMTLETLSQDIKNLEVRAKTDSDRLQKNYDDLISRANHRLDTLAQEVVALRGDGKSSIHELEGSLLQCQTAYSKLNALLQQLSEETTTGLNSVTQKLGLETKAVAENLREVNSKIGQDIETLRTRCATFQKQTSDNFAVAAADQEAQKQDLLEKLEQQEKSVTGQIADLQDSAQA